MTPTGLLLTTYTLQVLFREIKKSSLLQHSWKQTLLYRISLEINLRLAYKAVLNTWRTHLPCIKVTSK